ncbi:MAG: DUF4783 domain-containing protein [Ignavibacteriales bacterium]|nr:DUF4783 domain-containing protein [Ignavibacteriales bacterium]
MIFLLSWLVAASEQAFSQGTKRQASLSDELINQIKQIEASINSTSISNIEAMLAPEVLLNIRGGESGLFSTNQTVVILRNYLITKKIIQFNFSKMEITKEPFFATGGGVYAFKGKREHFQIYIGFVLRDGRLFLSQFNIY